MFEFVPMELSHQEKVAKWRSDMDITKFMYTDISGRLEDQEKWFNSIKNSQTEKYWIIKNNGVEIGVISLNDIDYKNQKSSAGFYIGEEEHRRLGFMVLPYLYNYAFNELKLNKLVAEIMDINLNVIKMHNMLGFTNVGVLRQHIKKNDQFHDVHLLELLQEEWEEVGKRYHKWTAEFQHLKE